MNTHAERRSQPRPDGLWQRLMRAYGGHRDTRRRDFFFLHVPRTGGSSVWHSLAADANDRGLPICDLYHLARQRPAPAPGVDELIRDARGSIRGRSCIYHVHDCVPLPHLDAPESLAATVLRDPVDRHVSHVMHLRGVLAAPAVDARLIAELGDEMGGEAMRALRQPTLPARDLILTLADCCPMLRNHYVWWFSTVLGLGAVPRAGVTDAARVARLAREMRARIALIGTHDDLEGFYRRLGGVIGLHPLPAGLSKSVNRGNEKPLLDETDRERLRGTFALDELLLDELGCRAATAPPAATPYAATPTAVTVAPRLAA